ARVCHVVKRDDFDGYGFNLHAEKGRPGQYIGKVDEGSPAESAGLRQGDRIIDVNGTNIGSETHKQVVERIKSVPNQTRLLVIDPRADIHDHQQLIQIEKIVASNLNNNNNNNHNTTNTIKNINNNINNTNGTSVSSSDMKIEMNSSSKDDVVSSTKSPTTNGNGNGNGNGRTSPLDSAAAIKNSHNNMNNNNHNMKATVTSTLDETTTNKDDSIKSTNSNNGTSSAPGMLNLHMTAAEMRAQLKSKKRIDPKLDSLDVRKKYEAIQKL
ncbi:unnamed protein product, partial [Diamesa serratosioi]